MKIRSAVPENDCLIVLVDGKKQKKTKKHKKHKKPPPTGSRLRKTVNRRKGNLSYEYSLSQSVVNQSGNMFHRKETTEHWQTDRKREKNEINFKSDKVPKYRGLSHDP